MKDRIQLKLNTEFQPQHLEVLNESNRHNVPSGSESHFKVTLVSEKFISIPRVKRHQLVYTVLHEEMKLIHALSLHTYTPEEWQKQKASPATPLCRGGSAK